MEHKKKNRRQFHKNNHGFTLLEMIVSFLLIGLFMVAASKVILNTASIYYEAKGTANGMQISSILTAKIRGEIEGARTDKLRTTDASGSTTTQSYAIWIGTDSTPSNRYGVTSNTGGIQFTNADGSHIYMGVNGSGYLYIYYYDSEQEEKKDWTFDKNTYLGYTITGLTFEKAGEAFNDNVIKMTLTVTSPRYGDYTVTEYIECYNFDTTTSLIQKE